MNKSIIRNMIASRQQLDQYFSYYKARFLQIQEENQSTTLAIPICLAGKSIELKFSSDLLVQAFRPSLEWAAEQAKNCIVSSGENTVFYIWQDTVSNYVPGDYKKTDIWKHNSASAKIFIPPGQESYITAYDYDHKEAYLCLKPSKTIDVANTSHPFKPLFHLWAKENNLLFVHSAGIEVEGAGILISGLGGRGKSTLAVNALLRQCGFIGDDYVLLEQTGRKRAYPIYSSGYLNPDMFDRMKELQNCVIGVDQVRNNKTLVTLMPMKDRFRESMGLDFILFPNFTENEPLSIYKIPPTRAMAQMIFSSANQNAERTNLEFMGQVSECLKGLPVYQFNMGTDLYGNMDFLKKFTAKWRKENVQIK